MSRYQIAIQNDLEYPVDETALIRAAEAVLEAQAVEAESAMTIVITDDESIAALNVQFRGIAQPTDVLSFPMNERMLPDDTLYLGDIVIAHPYSAAQAEREGFSLQDGLRLLVVHGALHLIGYDHDTPDRRARMWAAQDAALQALDVPLAIVPKLEDDMD